MGSSNLRQISKEVTKHVFDIKFLWELVGYFHHNGQLNLRCKPSLCIPFCSWRQQLIIIIITDQIHDFCRFFGIRVVDLFHIAIASLSLCIT